MRVCEFGSGVLENGAAEDLAKDLHADLADGARGIGDASCSEEAHVILPDADTRAEPMLLF